jgi:HlyD family secretion protein
MNLTRKRVLIGGGAGVVVVFAFIALSRASLGSFLDGEKEAARLGTLVIPVTATGTVQPNKMVQVKSKASGQVLKLFVVEGQMVKEGDVLIQLDPVDETRNLEAREADLDRAKSALEKARIALENQRRELPLQTLRAQAQLEDSTARLKLAEFQWDKMKGYIQGNVAGDVEGVSTETTHRTARAARDTAEANLKTAKNNEEIVLQSAEQDVVQAEATSRAAQKARDEAKLRLSETEIRARSGGMVFNIMVREGEMIQSGTQSLTGGTPVLTLADVSSIHVMAQVDEADIGAIRKIAPEYARPGSSIKLTDEEYAQKASTVVDQMKGRVVEVTVEAYRDQTYQGVIERILPEPQRVNNALAFNVRVRLVGDDLQKLIGMQADLAFTTEKLENVLLVKNEALFSEGRECFVYVPVRKSGSSRLGEDKKPVRIGVTDGTYTQILSGLKPGEEVWTRRPRQTEKERRESEKA